MLTWPTSGEEDHTPKNTQLLHHISSGHHGFTGESKYTISPKDACFTSDTGWDEMVTVPTSKAKSTKLETKWSRTWEWRKGWCEPFP